MSDDQSTHFGYRQVSSGEKTRLVGEVFTSVADNYDLMNDLMSLGMHRLWKWFAVQQLAARPGDRILDLAGGTGDLASRLQLKVAPTGSIVIADINQSMLCRGRDRLLDRGISSGVEYVRADAENLPFADNSFDLITIAFGLRNVTDQARALASMYRSVRYGGRVLILEFSRVAIPILARIYDRYSFKLIPWLGRTVARDEASYVYLVESIRRHPDQKTLAAMMVTAGFDNVSWQNLSGGIVALHSGYKL